MSTGSQPGSPAFHRSGAQRLLFHAPNPLVRAVLRSPAHRLLSGRLLLLTYTGRRSGERYTIPVQCVRDGDDLLVTVGWPERKLWWRSLRGPGTGVTIAIRGREREAIAEVRETADAVTVRLRPRAADD
jgi:hypothetical protein